MKKLIAILLCLVMTLSLLPASVLAAPPTPDNYDGYTFTFEYTKDGKTYVMAVSRGLSNPYTYTGEKDDTNPQNYTFTLIKTGEKTINSDTYTKYVVQITPTFSELNPLYLRIDGSNKEIKFTTKASEASEFVLDWRKVADDEEDLDKGDAEDILAICLASNGRAIDFDDDDRKYCDDDDDCTIDDNYWTCYCDDQYDLQYKLTDPNPQSSPLPSTEPTTPPTTPPTTLKIEKVVNGLDAWPEGNFNFTLVLPGMTSNTTYPFSLNSNQKTREFESPVTGSYTIQETSYPAVTGYTCTTTAYIKNSANPATQENPYGTALTADANGKYSFNIAENSGENVVTVVNTYTPNPPTVTIKMVIEGLPDSYKNEKFSVSLTSPENGTLVLNSMENGSSGIVNRLTALTGYTLSQADHPIAGYTYTTTATLNGTALTLGTDGKYHFDLAPGENTIVLTNAYTPIPPTLTIVQKVEGLPGNAWPEGNFTYGFCKNGVRTEDIGPTNYENQSITLDEVQTDSYSINPQSPNVTGYTSTTTVTIKNIDNPDGTTITPSNGAFDFSVLGGDNTVTVTTTYTPIPPTLTIVQEVEGLPGNAWPEGDFTYYFIKNGVALDIGHLNYDTQSTTLDEVKFQTGNNCGIVPQPPAVTGYTSTTTVTIENIDNPDGTDITFSNGAFNFSVVNDENVVTVTTTYTPNSNVNYTVKYLEQGTDRELAKEKKIETGVFDSTIKEDAIPITGYTAVAPVSKEVKLDAYNKVITFYYTANTDVSYTVKYLELGTDRELAKEKSVNGKTFDSTVEEKAIDIAGYTALAPTTLEVKLDAYNKVITFYYKANPLIRLTWDLSLTKVDADDNDFALAGAKFDLYRVDRSGDVKIGNYTTDENGNITATVSVRGDYYWVETASPVGYTLDGSTKHFTSTDNAKSSIIVTNEKTPTPPSLNGDDHYAYVIGYPDGLVHPEAQITRAETATIFFRLLNASVRDEYLTTENSFSDVSSDDWFNTAVSTMAALGIIEGYPDGSFGPNDPITRAEFTAIAARFDTSSASPAISFMDVYGHWAESYIRKAAGNGWVDGYPGNVFKPDQYIKRCEAMSIINRVLNRNPETPDDLLPDMIKWPDNMNTNAWYYLDVQEATNSHDFQRKTNNTEHWIKINPAPDWSALEK